MGDRARRGLHLLLTICAPLLACAWLVPSGIDGVVRRRTMRWPRMDCGRRALASADPGGSALAKENFLAWAHKCGISAPKIQLAEFPPGYRGVAARESIAAGEPLVTLPRSAALGVGDQQPTPFPEFVGAAFWNQQSLHVRLALVLLYERERARRGDSPIDAWLSMLPASHEDKPCRWPDAQLEVLSDQLLADEIRQQSVAIDTIHRQLVESAAGSASSTVSLADFRWAMDTVISRTFGASIPAVTSPGVWQTLALVLCSRVAREIPSVDMFNHNTQALSDTAYESATDSITLRSLDSDWKQGQQVFICYGCKANRALLKSYGFVQRENPVDFTLIPGGVGCARSVFESWWPDAEAEPGRRKIDKESEWRQRVQMVAQCGVLGEVEKMRLTAAGPSGQAVAGLRILLGNHSELAALAEMDASERLTAHLSVDTEQRVHRAVLALCAETAAASEGVCAGGASVAEEREFARVYREERCRLLRQAMDKVENSCRLAGDFGVVVDAIEDGWLERQQHDLLRSMHNLGF